MNDHDCVNADIYGYEIPESEKESNEELEAMIKKLIEKEIGKNIDNPININVSVK